MMTTMPNFFGKNNKKPKPYDKNSTSYLKKDSREGRLHKIQTDKGEFTFKDNRMGDD